jgi:hypothetical protein
MRIGVLTYHHTTNYGATLQCLALCRILSSLGHATEVIDYRPHKATRFYLRDNLRTPSAAYNIIKWLKMRAFVNRYMTLSPRVTASGLTRLCVDRRYDAVIAGSDQIWQQSPNSVRGWAPEYLLRFVPGGVRKIAYAPSSAGMIDFGGHADEARQLLNVFDHLSARDLETVRLVQALTGRHDISYVVDPTFLIDYSGLSTRPCLSDYLLLYGQVPSALVGTVERFAADRDLRIVSVGYRFQGKAVEHISASPESWLGYFADARFIITSFFHGTVFAIINRKPFVVLDTPTKAVKVKDLLHRFGLQSRVVDMSQAEGIISRHLSISVHLDWACREAIIAGEIDKSIGYLKHALEG